MKPRSVRPKVHTALLSFALLLIFSACTPGDSAPQETELRRSRVENSLSRTLRLQGQASELFSIPERLEHYHVPGVSVAVLDNGRIDWAKGYGVVDANSGEPVETTTLFQAASISKPVAAMAVLKLVEEGILDLDTPINEYLVSWKLPENRFTEEKPVTLRHLLTHTGGLTVHGFPGYATDEPLASTLEVLDGSGSANTAPIRVDTFPGSFGRYSGGGYTIVQQLLADVSGTPFPELMRELVLDPAGMPVSSYAQPLPPGRAGYAATAHMSDGTPVEGRWHIYPEMAAAGLWTNPTELAHLALDVQASFRGEPGRVLSQDMTRAQLTPGLGGYGLGFGVQGEGSSARFSHGGSNHGFRAQFLAFIEGGRGVFIMTNGDRGSALAQEIVLAVANEYDWPEPRYQEVALFDVPRDVLQEIAGGYRIVDQELNLEVTVVEDYLRVAVGTPGETESLQVLEIYPTAEDLFIDLLEGTRLRVDRDEAGSVTALQIVGGPRAERVQN